MKSTKNVLMTGVALAIALFASVQVNAMAKTVNPYLTPQQKSGIQGEIRELERRALDFDPKFKHTFPSDNHRNYSAAVNTAELNAWKSIYYGNKPYTDDQIEYIIESSTARVNPKAFGLN